MDLLRRSLAHYLISLIVLVTALALAVMSAVFYLQEKRDVLAELKDSISIDADQLSSGIALSIWNLDEVQARRNMESLMQNRSIEFIDVRAKGMGDLLLKRDSAWNPSWGGAIPSLEGRTVFERRIEYAGTPIGSATVSCTPEFALQRLHSRLTAMIGVFVLFELGLMVCMGLLIWRAVLLPLGSLESYANQVRQEARGVAPPTGRMFRGELESLRDSFAQMVILLQQRLDQLEAEAHRRRESEERTRALYDAVNDAIFIHESGTGRILDVNSRSCELYGYPKEELLSLSVGELSSGQPPYDQPSALAHLQRLDEAGPLLVEWHCKRHDGSLFWGEVSMRKTQLGGVAHIIVLVRDITERKREEERRQQLESRLHQAQKLESIGILAGGIAHDFNNILAAIVGCCELAREEAGASPVVSEHLDDILHAAARARDLVRQILAFSRHSKQALQPVSLQRLAREVLSLLKAGFPDGIEFVEELPDGLPMTMADPSQLHQVLMNLCTNAEHAMRGTHGRLVLSLSDCLVDDSNACEHPDLAKGRYLRLSVQDSGHGMSEETLSHIFDPFFTTKREGEGTGLGLSVVHGIIKSHHGAISVQSQPGKGSTFHILLPALEAQVATSNDSRAALPEHGKGARVLFVDNEKSLCLIAEKLLTKLGYVPTIISDPVTAVERFMAAPREFDLVISDLSMPGMTGLEFAAKVLELRPDIPVVILTGYLTNERLREAKAIGVAELVMKPLDTAAFSSVLVRHTHGVVRTQGFHPGP